MSKSSDLNLYDLSDVDSILNDPELAENSQNKHQDIINTRGQNGAPLEGELQVITTRGLQLEEYNMCASDEEDNISQTPDSVQTQLTIVQMA